MMNFRFKFVFAIIFLVIFFLGIMRTMPAAGYGEPLSVAMEATGAKVEEFSINAWVKLPSDKLSDEQLQDIVQEVMSQLGVESYNYQLTSRKTPKYNIVQARAICPAFHAQAIAQIIPGGISRQEEEGYLVVNIEAKAEENLSINDMKKKIYVITKKIGPSPQITTCLIGWLDGKLRAGEWHKALSDAFMAIDANIVDKLNSEQFASYTGFTSEIAEWLQVGDKKINVNMAMRYSQYDNRTYVTIGSPIITREY
ncbi:MAG: hypothetical protein H6Q68_1903 [Firmicutes bacterium]|nr:hypothetical protein [Bacillota bacterium]